MKIIILIILLSFPFVSYSADIYIIYGNGLKKPSYIMGTTHLICEKDIKWTLQQQYCLEISEQICMEMDVYGSMIGSGVIYKPLKQRLSSKQYSALALFLKVRFRLEISYVDRMSLAMTQSILMTHAVDCSFPTSIEADLMQRGQLLNKSFVGLETYREQEIIMNSIPDKQLIAGIMKIVYNFEDVKKEYNHMLYLFLKGNLKEIDKIVRKDDYYQEIIVRRNISWIPRMEKMMKKSTLFAVGVGHLSGVMLLLKQKGYKIKAI